MLLQAAPVTAGPSLPPPGETPASQLLSSAAPDSPPPKQTQASIGVHSTRTETTTNPVDGIKSVETSTTVSSGDGEVQLIRDVDNIEFANIALVMLVAYAILWLSQILLPKLAAVVPTRLRLYPLAVIPIIRLVTLMFASVAIVRLIFLVTFENFLVVAGAASVAIGFAFKDYVSSLIAGIVAVFERPYRPGDWVKIGDDYGEVKSVGMRSLSLQTPADDRITVPHQHLWSENISNSNDGSRTLMCVVNFYVVPDHDAQLIRTKLRDVAITSPYLNYDRPVLVMLSEEPLGTHYKVKLYPFDMRDQFALVSDITVRGKAAITAAGGRFATAAVSAS